MRFIIYSLTGALLTTLGGGRLFAFSGCLRSFLSHCIVGLVSTTTDNVITSFIYSSIVYIVRTITRDI